MNLADPAQRAVFVAAHADLPRQAPGSFASTARALELARTSAPPRRALDLACGPGMQTLALARLLPGVEIAAVDLHGPYLRELGRRAGAAGVDARIQAVRADMGRLPFRPGVFDLVWCEGGAYLLGVEPALTAWRELLAPGGRIAFTDAVWLRDDPPDPVRLFWQGYAGMRDVPGVRASIRRAGLTPIGDFVVPEADWWDDYYAPLGRRLDALRPRHAGDPKALAVLDECRAEIDLFREHADCYGYGFFVAAV